MPKLLEETVVNTKSERKEKIFVLYDKKGNVIETFINEAAAVGALIAEIDKCAAEGHKIHSDLGLDGSS
jgi:uncharacterized protein YuzE